MRVARGGLSAATMMVIMVGFALFLPSASTAAYRDVVLADSPVGYWRFAEVTGSSALDETPAQSNGTYLNGVTLGTPGAVSDSTAMTLDGIDDHVSVPNAGILNPANAITLEAWVKPTSGAFGSIKPIVLKANAAHVAPYYQYGLFLWDNGSSHIIRVALAIGGSFNPVDISAAWNYGVWQHIAATWDGATVRVYLNGFQVGTGARSGSLPAYNSALLFGCFQHLPKTSTYCYKGSIDDGAIYSTALSATQIQAHFDASADVTPPPPSPYADSVNGDSPVSYWRLGETSGLVMRDSRPANHHGDYLATPTLGVSGAIKGDPNTAVGFGGGRRALVPYSADLNPAPSGGLTVEAWVKVSALGPNYMAIASSRSVSSGFSGWTLYVNNNWDGTGYRFEFWHGGGDAWTVVRGATPVVVGRWFHVVGVLRSGRLHMYVDGLLDDGDYRTGPEIFTPNPDQPMRIGYGSGTGNVSDYYMEGTIDEVAIYAAALSADRIAVHYHRGVGGALADRFRPILRFDSGEDWRPLNIETFLSEDFDPSESGTDHHRVCRNIDQPPTECADITSWRTLQIYRNGSSSAKSSWPYINIHGVGNEISNYGTPDQSCAPGDLMDCDTNATRTSIYWHAVGPFPESNYIYLDYWFFYRFNKFGGGYDHEADWEGFTAAYRANDSDPQTFSFAALSAHGIQWHYLKDTLICDQSTAIGSCSANGKRVRLFVADGSHANYPQGCNGSVLTCSQTTLDGETQVPPEKGYDGAIPWGANDDPAALKPFPDSRGWDATTVDPTWVDWPGWWGIEADGTELQSHVESPDAERPTDVFDRPDVWVTCTERYTDPNSVQCDGTEGPRSPANARGESARGCRVWNGPGVTASVCDIADLRTALRAGAVANEGPYAMGGTGRTGRPFASGRGISQLVGTPLGYGEQLTITGPLRRTTRLTVRSRGASGTAVAEFTGIESPSAVVKLAGPDPKSLVVEDSRGVRHPPSRIISAPVSRGSSG